MCDTSRGEAGFTLTEMLATMIIVVLLSAVVSVGVAFGGKQYARSMRSSEGLVLCSTLESAIRNELSYSESVRADASGAVEFASVSYARNIGDTPYWHLAGVDGRAALVRGSLTEPLLPETAYANGMEAEVSCTSDGSGVVHVDIVVSDPSGGRVASSEFDVEPQNSPVDVVETLDSA